MPKWQEMSEMERRYAQDAMTCAAHQLVDMFDSSSETEDSSSSSGHEQKVEDLEAGIFLNATAVDYRAPEDTRMHTKRWSVGNQLLVLYNRLLWLLGDE
jgi:hypothetical protein